MAYKIENKEIESNAKSTQKLGNKDVHWVLIRGLGREHAHWGDFPKVFKEALPFAHLYHLDLPGAGDRFQDTCPLSISAIVEDLRNHFLKTYPHVRKVNLLAISLGGMVALDWKCRFPNEVQNVYVINTSLSSLSPFYRRLQWTSYPSFFKNLLASDLVNREKGILSLVSNNFSRHEELSKEWAEVAKLRPVSWKNFLRQLYAASQFHIDLKCLNSEDIKVMVALGDRLVNPSCSESLANSLSCQIYKHPWGGHDLCVDDPQWICDVIKKQST